MNCDRSPVRYPTHWNQLYALAGEREAEWRRIGGALFLSDDEKREALGYAKRRGEKRAGRNLERRYSEDQPRVPAGSPDGGQWTSGGGASSSSGNFSTVLPAPLAEVIRICVASGISRFIDRFGNKSYAVTYECFDGRTYRREGTGHDFPGFIRDPSEQVYQAKIKGAWQEQIEGKSDEQR